MATLEDVATELYGLPPDAFTATRNTRAKEAKADGDKELAAAIAGLPKPTAAAWAVNLLVRSHPDDIGRLLSLGAMLRDAQAALAGAELRTLNRQQHQVMAAVVRQAAGLVAEHGQRLSDPVALQVEGTLRAAMTDPAAADVVLGGLLVANLQSTGLEPVDVTGASALDGPPLADVPRSPARLHVVPDAPAPARSSTARPRPARRPARADAGAAEVAQPDPARAKADRARAERREAERAEAERAEAARVAAERAEAERREAERLLQEAQEDVRAADEDEAVTAGRLEEVDEELATRAARLQELAEEAAETARQIEELTEKEHALDLETRALTAEARTTRRERERVARAAEAAAERAAAARERLESLPRP
ncbi:MAG: hypothetical protein JWP95_430 [Actinotalea sp.]|nr:hypothetical protein [Actinotalea sp.]